MAEKKESVCVTGGGGYVGSWLIKLLLSKGYKVHATVRDPDNEKTTILKKLENASENLQLFKADLLDYNSISAAINGCTGVFHVASPLGSDMVPNPEAKIFEPAVTGTNNVLKASSSANVKRVVVVSSIAAVTQDPNRSKDQIFDESCWSDTEACKTAGTGHYWYISSKTVAERQALEYGKKNGLQVVTICPSYVVGPMLQSTLHGTTLIICTLLKDGLETTANAVREYVDVRDVAEALLLIYEKPEAEGRYICTSHRRSVVDLVEKLKNMYPNYHYPKKIADTEEDWKVSSEKLQKLGWRYRSLEETLVDSVKDYQEKGVLE